MEQERSHSNDQGARAEAALELLRSLAKAGEDPDKFTQACLDWSRLSQDATSIPEFQSVLSMLSPDGVDRDVMQPQTPRDSLSTADVFYTDAKGIVSEIPKDLSETLSMKPGDTVDPALFQFAQDPPQTGPLLIEIRDRFRIARRVKIYPEFRDDQLTGFAAQVILAHLTEAARAELRAKHNLTTSELSILELVFQRYSLEQITEIRGITLNTVRTHVARIISKLNCHSLVEAISTTIELSSALADQPRPSRFSSGADENIARRISLGAPDETVEYRRYGRSEGRPVLILHSLEYGHMPSPNMISAARDRNLNLIFPIRPGFGKTQATPSLPSAAQVLKDFIRALQLNDVTLVGLSTGAPLALGVQENNRRIRNSVLVNYGLNVADKLGPIQPAWIRGMLRMSLNSPSSFAFGFGTLSSMIRTFGGERFYRRLYANQQSDLAYLEAHADLFQASADYIVNADKTNVRLDIVSAFMGNRDLETVLKKSNAVSVINSSDQHGVGPEKVQADAARLNVNFRHVEHPGRNWMFQHPDQFFDMIELDG